MTKHIFVFAKKNCATPPANRPTSHRIFFAGWLGQWAVAAAGCHQHRAGCPSSLQANQPGKPSQAVRPIKTPLVTLGRRFSLLALVFGIAYMDFGEGRPWTVDVSYVLAARMCSKTSRRGCNLQLCVYLNVHSMHLVGRILNNVLRISSMINFRWGTCALRLAKR